MARNKKQDSLNFMNSVQVTAPRRSKFDLTHDVKLSCNMGELVPVMVTDLVPGDKVNVATDSLIRFAPLVSPMFHRCFVTFHTWFVPYRILWENWSDYITETKTAGVLPVHPKVSIQEDGTDPDKLYSRLCDYLGVPPPPAGSGLEREMSALRFAAYQCVYNEFYRDQNLVTEVPYQLNDGANSLAELGKLRLRAWQHDYFTSNLPFAQKGDPVKLPIELDDTPVKRGVDPSLMTPPATETTWPTPGQTAPSPSLGNIRVTNEPSDNPLLIDIGQQLYADNSAVQGQSTLEDLRVAWSVQRYLERAARGGTRLVEWIKSIFNETLPDYTAQRPQYIGGTKSPVQISEIPNTSGIVGELPQGNLAGRGTAVNTGNLGFYKAREHGVCLTIMTIMPETGYQQGLERTWSKINDPKEYLNPMFANLGEQATISQEIMLWHADYQNTFGYLPRYSEYRTIPSRVAGDFRTTLAYWHMSRIFDPAVMPTLNKTFIECDATHRVFADTDPTDQKMFVHVLNRVSASRPLPFFGTPL